jgi:hypothetical protein
LVFCTVRKFNELRVAKLTRLVTSGRSFCWPMFGGMACINFSRIKMSAANQAYLFRAVGQDVFLVGAVGGLNHDRGQQQESDLQAQHYGTCNELIARWSINETTSLGVGPP